MIKNFFQILSDLFKSKEKKVSEKQRIWIARNVWNDPSLAEQDTIYKGKIDES